MDTNWLNIHDFLEEERRWDPQLKFHTYDALCEKYNFKSATNGWVLPDGIKIVPNLANEQTHDGKPDIRMLFSHYHSFRAEDGCIYWTVSPNDCELSKQEIIERLNANYLIGDIIDGLRFQHTLVFRPMNVALSCNRYQIEQGNNGKYELHRINKYLEQNDIVAKFDTPQEAEAFKLGFELAYAQAAQMLN
jgi:hypothetical protein